VSIPHTHPQTGTVCSDML